LPYTNRWHTLRMIPLKSKTYHIENIELAEFWEELDKVTLGQSLNPEFGYVNQHVANFESTFAGRKSGKNFIVFLHRPLTQGFRTEILAKGTVSKFGRSLSVDINYEIPLHSLAMFLLLVSMVVIPTGVINPIVACGIFILMSIIFYLIVKSNLKKIQKEIKYFFNTVDKK